MLIKYHHAHKHTFKHKNNKERADQADHKRKFFVFLSFLLIELIVCIEYIYFREQKRRRKHIKIKEKEFLR